MASNNSQTYPPRALLVTGGNTVLIQAGNFFYQALGTTLMLPGVVITFAAPTGNAFTNPGGAQCNYVPLQLARLSSAAIPSPAPLQPEGPIVRFLTNPSATAVIQPPVPMSQYWVRTVIRGWRARPTKCKAANHRAGYNRRARLSTRRRCRTSLVSRTVSACSRYRERCDRPDWERSS